MEQEIYILLQKAFLVLVFLGVVQVFYLLYKKTDSFIGSLLISLLSFLLLRGFLFLWFSIGVVFCAVNGWKIYRKLAKKRDRKPKTLERTSDEILYLETGIGTVTIENPYRGTIVIGGAGSGKSKSLFYPIIQQFMENRYTGILYDFKSPELSELAHYYKNDKINFAILSFKNHEISTRVNPLSPKYVTKQAIAFELATVLINNLLPESIKSKDYWTRTSISILSGVIWYLRNNYPQFSSLPHLIAMVLAFPSTVLIEKLTQDPETAGMIASLKEAHEMKAEKQIAGVVGTLKNSLAQLNIPEVFYLLSEDETSLDLNNPEQGTFLCVGNDSSLSDTYAPIISLIVSVSARLMNQPNKLKSAIILDEAPTLYIPNFEQIPATARSNRVATVLGVQDYSQMVDKYGRDKAQVMISNLGNQFYGRTVNEQTAKMIISLFGKHDVKFKSSSKSASENTYGSSSSSKSISESYQQRERVKISDITNASPGKFYGVIAQGNYNELLGVQFGEVDSKYRKFEKKEDSYPREIFNKIYKDVEEIKSSRNQEQNSTSEEIVINLD